MENAVTLIYLFDEETLGQLHKDWPQGMRTALCLDENGGGNIALFHIDEYWHVAARISDLLGRDDSDFVFVPTFSGYPTRRISFSEEQQMCGMIANIDDLPQRARLHLAQMDCGDDQTPNFGPQDFDTADKTEITEVLPIKERPAETAIEHLPEDVSQKSRVTSRLPSGFHCPSDPAELAQDPIKARLKRVGHRLQLTVAGASVSGFATTVPSGNSGANRVTVAAWTIRSRSSVSAIRSSNAVSSTLP